MITWRFSSQLVGSSITGGAALSLSLELRKTGFEGWYILTRPLTLSPLRHHQSPGGHKTSSYLLSCVTLLTKIGVTLCSLWEVGHEGKIYHRGHHKRREPFPPVLWGAHCHRRQQACPKPKRETPRRAYKGISRGFSHLISIYCVC